MNKKLIIIIAIVAILLLGFYFMYTQNTIKIDNTYFTIPEGYHVIDEGDFINLTSDNNYLCLMKNPVDENITTVTHKYSDYKKSHENDTLKFENYQVNGHSVTKSTSVKHPEIVHYWFVKDGKTYEFYTWASNSNSDRLVANLIKTMKTGI